MRTYHPLDAVRSDDAKYDVVILAFFSELLICRFDAIQIIRVDVFQKIVVGRLERARFMAINAKKLI